MSICKESLDLQDSSRDILSSNNDQLAEQNVLPPFSKRLHLDKELKLSQETFEKKIYDFFKDKNKDITPLNQLRATPPFPTPHVLAQFASKAYTDYKTGETDAQYEKRLALPDGWKLLTTASNSRAVNGYFGAAYWHPERQQVVITHRGTGPTNLGTIWTDVNSVEFNDCGPQIRSASSFTHKVVEVLQTLSRMNGVSFQLFFTGHSLGGWLAQVTTFTTKYLKVQGNVFLKRCNDNVCYHPHTVVFDSPGCKYMLSQMKDTFEVRLDGRSITLKNLDITSYLSAPNRINTSNKHVGTVYRIFPDLSDMTWWEKHSTLYDSATNSLSKIVQAFDPKTGQVLKDQQGNLKIQVVVDWPLTVGFRHDTEYKNFFKWADHLNNYHPDVRDETVELNNYYPIRYQTKPYDEGVSRLNIFSLEECQFLQDYHQLRQSPEDFRPKELFCVMEDNQAQEDAEKMLQNFEIGNDKINCPDASSLRALIPYLKRLLQLFPDIKEETKRALSTDEVRNRVYQVETKRCIDRLNQSPLDFKGDALILRDFLRSANQQILHIQMDDGDEWTGLIKVYQALQKTGCLIEGHYTVLNLKRLLTVNQVVDLRKLIKSAVTPYLLLMACEDNQELTEEITDIIRNLFHIIKEKPNIKMIFTTPSAGSTVHILHQIGMGIFGEGFVRSVDRLTWSDLTTSSQERLLEKSVIFQGVNISLSELMSTDSPVTKFLPLGALLDKQKLIIANPLPISNVDNESYYIGRTLLHQKAIKLDMLKDKAVRDSSILLARSEEEYEQLCQRNPNSTVHWVEEEKSGKFVWQRSQGNLEILRRYSDPESSHTYTPDDIDNLLEQAQHHGVMVISGPAGMGKSTVMKHLSRQIKKKFPAKWVVRIDLNDHTDVLQELKQEQIDKKKAIEFVSKKLLKLESDVELQLFKQCCEQKQKVRIIIMLDGFDEISPYYEDTVIDLLQALRQTAIEQLWVTTRPHLRRQLEDQLQQLSYTLKPFSEEDQVKFLKKFWSLNDWFTKPHEKEGEMEGNKLHIYAKHLIKKLAESISDKDKEFTGIPLQCRMLAEAFDKEVASLCQSVESTPELPFLLDLLGLYEIFIERKYDIYQVEKSQVSVSNIVVIEKRKRDLKIMREAHQLLALKCLFTEEQMALFQNRKCTFSAEELARIGILHLGYEGKPHFFHRTFADYFVADFLVNCLTEGKNISEQVLKDIFLEEDYRLVRVFMDTFLRRSKPTKQMLKEYGNQIHALWKHSEPKLRYSLYDDDDDDDDRFVSRHVSPLLLHLLAREGSANIIGFLLDSLEAAEHIDTVKKLLLARDSIGRTVWHQAVLSRNTHTSEMLWEYVKMYLTVDELRRNLLLAKDDNKMNAWQLTVREGKAELVLKQWELAKEILTQEEINNKFLLATDYEGLTAWHLATCRNEIELLQKVWDWANENLTREEINNKLLLVTDNKGRTVLHLAAESGNLEALEKVLVWAKEKLTTEEINYELLLVPDHEGLTAWHVAAYRNQVELLQKVWDWANEKLTQEEVKDKLLLATENKERTVLHLAAESGNLEALEKVWYWANEILTTEEINNRLLLATDYEGLTAWHVAAYCAQIELLQKVWDWTNEKLTTKEAKDKLLLATDNKARTVLHLAAESGNLEALEKVWNWANEKLTTEEVKNRLLLATDHERLTAWHVATYGNEIELLQKVWDWANENLTREEINNKLLLATDNKARTVLHLAAESGNVELLEKVWDWANQNLTREEINNKLLLVTDNKGRTVLHLAAESGNLEALEEVWNWANEKLTPEDVNNKLLLATDHEGLTAWHVAAYFDQLELLQEVWNWANEKLTKEDVNNKLLLATVKGITVLHLAAESGNLELLEKVWDWAKKNLTTEEINKLLLATDNKRKTAFHVVAEFYNLEIVQEILGWARKKLTTEDLNKLLSVTDERGRTVFHVAAEGNKLHLVQEIFK